ncbi:MAG: DMT family protein [Phycisphaerales bacterium]|nr:DMT family protein [Phycisphaerales bacterium]
MMRALAPFGFLFASNVFMTWAWYGHLKRASWSIPLAIAVSWCIALPEYMLQVPGNRLGHISQGGPYTAPQLKIIQEAITIGVFIGFAILVLGERPRPNEYIAFALIVAAVVIAMWGRPGHGVVTPPAASSTVQSAPCGAISGA